MRNQVMPWIDLLPNVNPSLMAQRDVVATKMALADDYMRRAERLRREAYFDSMRLECRAMAACGLDAVERAKRVAG
ncbi:stable inheritance protein KleA [Aromatoleum anaerobium]|uniref:Protein kleA n=1 Tax=Aromatoleum anaerobium TaxID=182180 RepID=A0ABX1PQZ4_9RHOO|nr:stable inheritance protein KleA [Aromatoleum anaerobium]MCK0505337.1 stable inheritance protein KleA [Aromatoleum anaerobium]